MEKNKSVKTQQKTEDFVPETIAAIVSCKTMGQAAEMLQIDRSTLYYRMENYPQIRETVEKMKEQALLNLKQGSMRASEVVIEHLEHKEKGLEAAQDLLDRVGIGSKSNAGPVLQNNILVMPSELLNKYDISSDAKDSSK